MEVDEVDEVDGRVTIEVDECFRIEDFFLSILAFFFPRLCSCETVRFVTSGCIARHFPPEPQHAAPNLQIR